MRSETPGAPKVSFAARCLRACRAPREATVRFTGSLAKIAPRLVPGAKLATAPDNSRVARLVVRNLDGLGVEGRRTRALARGRGADHRREEHEGGRG